MKASLALATGTFIPQGRVRDWASAFASAVAACMATVLAWGGVQLAMSEREAGSIIAAGVPAWLGQLALPVGFALIASPGVEGGTGGKRVGQERRERQDRWDGQ